METPAHGLGMKNEGMSTAVGVVRDSDGNWITDFAHNIGRCSVSRAELWGVLNGMKNAWNYGFRKVILETDSKLAVKLIRSSVLHCHPLSNLVLECQGFLKRD